MKNRISKSLVALVPLLLLATMAQAQATSSHWVFDPVSFRSHSAAGFVGQQGPNAFNDYGVQDAVDSLAASGIAKFDTTVAVSTDGWALPLTAGSATDSTCYAHLFIYDSGISGVTLGQTSATAESIYIKTQVSANGNKWHDAAIIPGQAPVLNAFTVQTTVNAAVLTFVSSTNTGISDKLWSVQYVSTNTSAALKSGQDVCHLWQFPYVRWIIMGSRSLNHSYSVKIGHASALATKQPGQ